MLGSDYSDNVPHACSLDEKGVTIQSLRGIISLHSLQ